MVEQVHDLLCSEIQPGDNDRKTFSGPSLEELAESISEHGLAQPITVRALWKCTCCGREDPDFPEWCEACNNDTFSHFYQIVAGERRFRAVSEVLKGDTIAAIVRQLSDEEADAIMLAENVHRQDLRPTEEAQAYRKRMDRYGWSQAEVARKANVSAGKVKSRLDLLRLAPDIQGLVDTGELPISFGARMSILDLNRQRIAIRWLREQISMPTIRSFGAVVDKLYSDQVQDAMFDLDALLVPQVIRAMEAADATDLAGVLPTISHLPDLPTRLGGLGRILDDYIALLLERGQTNAAGIITHLWVKLMEANYCAIPPVESRTLQAITIAQ